jgi:hypothetical protein
VRQHTYKDAHMSMEHSPTPAGGSRRFGRIPEATQHSGLSRSALYQLARKHRGLFRKHGAVTFVDFQLLDGILEELPPADLKSPTSTQVA